MPIHMGFRDKIRVGIGVIQMGVIGMKIPGGRDRIAPSDVIAAAKKIKQSQRVTRCHSYQDFQAKLDPNQFTPTGWNELQLHMTNIWGYFATNNGLQLYLIVHNSDPGRMKRIEVETTTGHVHTVWTDS